MQKKKEKPDFKSHDEKRKRGSMKPRQTEEEEKQKSSEMKEPSWMRKFLRSMGRFLIKIFTREKIEIIDHSIYKSKKAYEVLQQDKIVHYNKAEEKVTIIKKDDKDVKEVSSTLEPGSIDQVDRNKGGRAPNG